MWNIGVLLVIVLVSGCAAPSKPPAPPRKTVADLYVEALERHMAPINTGMKGLDAINKCYRRIPTNPQALQPCLDELLPPTSYIPKDLKSGETLSDYVERKEDEWGEKDCFYKGLMDARYIGENQRIEDQCKRDLEIKRLRKAVEKLNTQNQR